MRILAIDPGSERSAYVIYESDAKRVLVSGINDNTWFVHEFLPNTRQKNIYLAVEMIASYGMPVGKTVFDTCVWIGRFIQAWGLGFGLVYRQDVKMCLCHSTRAKDSNVRQAIIDRYEPTGGGATPQIGTKVRPGPLYGIKKDIWSALGVAITYNEIVKIGEN